MPRKLLSLEAETGCGFNYERKRRNIYGSKLQGIFLLILF